MFIMNKYKFLKNNLSSIQGKKQEIMLVILTLLILAIIIVTYFGISGSSKYRKPYVFIEKEDKLYLINKTIDEINFDVHFLDYLEDFEIYGIRPSGETEKGTVNPFLQN